MRFPPYPVSVLSVLIVLVNAHTTIGHFFQFTEVLRFNLLDWLYITAQLYGKLEKVSLSQCFYFRYWYEKESKILRTKFSLTIFPFEVCKAIQHFLTVKCVLGIILKANSYFLKLLNRWNFIQQLWNKIRENWIISLAAHFLPNLFINYRPTLPFTDVLQDIQSHKRSHEMYFSWAEPKLEL